MTNPKMHRDEVDTPAALVERLIAEQFPHWREQPVVPVVSSGTDNAMFRLGQDKVVRLPRIPAAASKLEKEQHWLPRLAPTLPLAVPTPLALGKPDLGYPWCWSVYRWLEGDNATLERLGDPCEAARQLAGFIAALQRIDTTHGPAPGAHNSGRGVPLPQRDRMTRAAIEQVSGMLELAPLYAAWECALRAPVWSGPSVWIHGDLQAGNLLAKHGQLSAVIDFGCIGVGDPACDLAVAWNLFATKSRDAFRAALQVDAASWARGRGWALSTALVALPYYRSSNPVFADASRRTIEAVLSDTCD